MYVLNGNKIQPISIAHPTNNTTFVLLGTYKKLGKFFFIELSLLYIPIRKK